MDDLLREFLVETSESLDSFDVQLVRFEHEPDNRDVLRALFRLAHTIKGTCGFLGLPRLEQLSHAAEGLLGRFRDGAPVTRDAVTLILASVDRIKTIIAALERTAAEPPGSDGDLIGAIDRAAERLDAGLPATGGGPEPRAIGQEHHAPRPHSVHADEPHLAHTLRVNVDTLEQLLGMVSELVLTRNQLLEVSRQQTGHAFSGPLQRLSLVTTQLQDCVMKTRMQPINSAWRMLPRLVRDLAIELDKDIALDLAGAETELDRQVLDLIKDPLTHLVRNAADHGLESRAERRAAGKPARGTITLRAYHVGGSIIIEVGDDGRGLDHERIRAKAFERGLITEVERERLTDEQVAKFIFHPGFSTATAVTAISGRGVGLDVVHSNVEQIGGAIDIQSQTGRGAAFILSLPLTLAIVPALLVGAGGEQFAIPQSAVVELVHVDGATQARIDDLDGGRVLIVRGDMLPLVSLAGSLALQRPNEKRTEGYVAILSVRGGRFGVLVDKVFHTEEIVVKPMSALLRQLQVYSGNTVLGDGSVVLILDPSGLARATGVLSLGPKQQPDSQVLTGDAPAARHAAMALLVFRFGGRRCALPLSAIARLEEVDPERIERAAGQPVMQYHGRLLPLAGALPAPGAGKAPCLILSHGDASVGLAVESIVDVIEQEVALDGAAVPGVLGASILNGETMDLLDALHYLRAAHPDIDRRGARRARRALVIEGQAFFRDMITPTLRAAGFETTAAATLALALADEPGAFDVAIVDPALVAPPEGAALLSAGPLAPGGALIAWCDDVESLKRDWTSLGYAGAASKFDRARLLALLGDVAAPMREAA